MAQRAEISDSKLAQLARALPSPGTASEGSDLDVRARGALAILIEAALTADICSAVAADEDARLCPNCGVVASSKTSPYCGECCREQAAFVRQMRGRVADGSLLDERSQTMKGEQMWRLLGGGLPRRLALVPESARQRVFKRTEGKCETCGAPATTIDNTGSG